MKPHDRLMGLDLPHGGQWVALGFVHNDVDLLARFLISVPLEKVCLTVIKHPPRRSQWYPATLKLCLTVLTRRPDTLIMTLLKPMPFFTDQRFLLLVQVLILETLTLREWERYALGWNGAVFCNILTELGSHRLQILLVPIFTLTWPISVVSIVRDTHLYLLQPVLTYLQWIS